MLAKHHEVVPALFFIKDRVPLVGVAESARQVELPLCPPEITGIRAILVGSGHLPVEVIRHMFDGVQTQAIGFEPVYLETRSADQVASHILDIGGTVVLEVLRGVRPKLFGGRIGAQRRAGPIDEPTKINCLAVFVLIVVLRPVEIAHKRILGMGRAFTRSEIGVRRLVGNIDEIRKSQVLHLPSAPPIARVVPFAVKSILSFSQMKILRHHTRVKFRLTLPACWRVFAEPRYVECSMVHDIVKIHTNTKTVGDFDHLNQLCLCAIARAHGIALVFGTKIKGIPQIISDRQSTTTLRRRRQPD